MELPVLADCTYQLKDLPREHVARCSCIEEAYRMCLNKSIVYRTHQTWAELLGISRGAFTAILNADRSDRPRYMPHPIKSQLTRLAGNRAIYQWEEMELKGELYSQKTAQQEMAELEARLAELKRTA